MTVKELVAATGNQGKLRELTELLEPLGIKVYAPAECGIAGLEVEETGDTFEENAMLKAAAYAKAAGMPAVADDSGLMVDALGGAPGVYSARYGGAGHDDAWRVGYLLSNIENVPDGKRGGRFVSALAYATPEGEGFVVRGECEGVILREPKGDGGFGYDPIFLFEPDGLTFSQLSEDRKNEVSHRGAAMRSFTKKLGELQ
ncbi:dITP/XTP pyrophosphatase [bioreactor metagenome]|uniref:dITP/XTP pyrophosphatase n=1 Tax=bioreactor metagenome TaxID=1076179 RepID=A0A644X5A0_9ZZZZ